MEDDKNPINVKEIYDSSIKFKFLKVIFVLFLEYRK